MRKCLISVLSVSLKFGMPPRNVEVVFDVMGLQWNQM